MGTPLDSPERGQEGERPRVEIGFTLSSEEFGPTDLVRITRLADAGYDHLYVHQVGSDQEGAMRFYEREVSPKIG